jgi:hypothetical protein
MSVTLQADKEGNLYLPHTLLPGAAPLASYRVSQQRGELTISKSGAETRPFWETATPEQKVEALEAWLKEVATPVGLSDYAVSRDSIYD